jgi:hypothetical protein
MKRAGSTHMAANRNPELHSAVGLGLDRECSPMKQAPRVSESIPWNGFADDIARTGRDVVNRKKSTGTSRTATSLRAYLGPGCRTGNDAAVCMLL